MKIKKKRMKFDRICIDCGVTFVGGNRTLRCPSCRKLNLRERGRMYAAQKAKEKKAALEGRAPVGVNGYKMNLGLSQKLREAECIKMSYGKYIAMKYAEEHKIGNCKTKR